ncbi:MAG: hypothetical protein AAB969_02135, partial [Patescibacteria group bacterium]
NILCIIYHFISHNNELAEIIFINHKYPNEVQKNNFYYDYYYRPTNNRCNINKCSINRLSGYTKKVNCDDPQYSYGNCPKGCVERCLGNPLYSDDGKPIGETASCNGPHSCSYPQ